MLLLLLQLLLLLLQLLVLLPLLLLLRLRLQVAPGSVVAAMAAVAPTSHGGLGGSTGEAPVDSFTLEVAPRREAEVKDVEDFPRACPRGWETAAPPIMPSSVNWDTALCRAVLRLRLPAVLAGCSLEAPVVSCSAGGGTHASRRAAWRLASELLAA
uniref:Uncharacterized protein n=1 Tax=Pyrodinium bahamense TaxID=73915 RepID=A0A7S0FBZ5_9DINO